MCEDCKEKDTCIYYQKDAKDCTWDVLAEAANYNREDNRNSEWCK